MLLKVWSPNSSTGFTQPLLRNTDSQISPQTYSVRNGLEISNMRFNQPSEGLHACLRELVLKCGCMLEWHFKSNTLSYSQGFWFDWTRKKLRCGRFENRSGKFNVPLKWEPSIWPSKNSAAEERGPQIPTPPQNFSCSDSGFCYF